jgi:Chemotaxis protein histidine kinase and related kinases
MKNIRDKLISENNYSSNTIKMSIENEKHLIASKATDIVNNPVIFNAFNYNIFLDYKSYGKATANNFTIMPVNEFGYSQMCIDMSNLIGQELAEKGILKNNVTLFDSNAKLLSNTLGTEEEFKDTGNESYIQKMIDKRTKFGALNSIGTIIKKNSRFFIKGIDRVYTGGPIGIAVVTVELNNEFLEKMKDSVNKEIIILNKDQILASTIKIDHWEKDSFKYGNDSKDFYIQGLKINNKSMVFSFTPITDYDNNVIAMVGTGFYVDEINSLYQKSMMQFLPIQILSLIITLLLLFFILRKLFNPFNQIITLTQKISKGEYEIEKSGSEMKEFTSIMNSMEVMSKAIKNREIQNKQLLEKVYTLLDNSDEGFLSFDTSLVLDPEYSRECEVVFGKSIKEENIVNLLFDENNQQRNLFPRNINLIFNEADEFKKEVLISLLPKVSNINSKIIKLKYRLLDNNRMMLIITDITHEKELEEKIKDEQGRLKLVVSSIVDRNDFFDLLDSYREYWNFRLNEILKNDMSKAEKYADIYRNVHTFKGNFAQFNFIHLPKELHELENGLSKINKNSEEVEKDIYELFNNCRCNDALKKDMSIITTILGDEFLKQKNKIHIDEEQIKTLKDLAQIISNEVSEEVREKSIQEIVSNINTLRFVPLKQMLNSYPEYTYKLAERLEKSIYNFRIEGSDIRVNPQKFLAFTKSLVHVFRNAVDHGIESPDERIEANKDETGKIVCSIDYIGEEIGISIQDDGRGIDIQKVKEKAVQKGSFSREEVENLTKEEIVTLVFGDDFSTKEKTSEISGRGYGLSATLKELHRIGGEAEVTTTKGKGTIFTFKFKTKEI